MLKSETGMVGKLDTTLPIAMTMGAFSGIAWYICIELNIRIFMVFKRRQGLYFWSLLLCSWGTCFQPLFALFKEYAVLPNVYVSGSLIFISWCFMVTGQSLVLYSRIHIIMHNTQRRKWILYMIIVDAILFHIPTIVLGFLANSSQSPKFAAVFSAYDKAEMTVFAIQEFIISSVYVYETRKFLKSGTTLNNQHTLQMMKHLIYVNLLIIFLDVTLVAIQYINLFYIIAVYKPCVYGIKLRVEFAILNQLKAIAQGHPCCFHISGTGPKSSRPSKAEDATQDNLAVDAENCTQTFKRGYTGYSTPAATNGFMASPHNVKNAAQTTSISI